MNEDLEKSLRAALRAESAPPDFAAKILAKTSDPVVNAPQRPRIWRHPLALGLAAALLLSVPALQMERRRSEAARAMKAKQDLLIALAITRDQLQQVRGKIERNGE